MRIAYEDAGYHVISRGHDRHTIFRIPHYYDAFLATPDQASWLTHIANIFQADVDVVSHISEASRDVLSTD